MTEDRSTAHVLTGLDGANPLAFLAALGTLRTLTTAWPDREVRMGWTTSLGAWRPFLRIEPAVDQETIVETVNTHVSRTDDLFPSKLRADSEAAGPHSSRGAPKWRDKLRFPCTVFAEHARVGARNSAWNAREELDAMAALASDAVVDQADGIDVAQRTLFDFTAGQQSFMDQFDKLAQAVEATHIRNALFGPWSYTADPGVSLRWDPIDEGRQYALLAIDPTASRNPIVSVPGANLLAASGLVFFPVVPGKNRAEQPGIGRFDSRRAFRWPIWESAVPSHTIRSLLCLDEIREDAPDHAILRSMGIPMVYQSRIVMPSGRYRNFTPAQAV